MGERAEVIVGKKSKGLSLKCLVIMLGDIFFQGWQLKIRSTHKILIKINVFEVMKMFLYWKCQRIRIIHNYKKNIKDILSHIYNSMQINWNKGRFPCDNTLHQWFSTFCAHGTHFKNCGGTLLTNHFSPDFF